MVQANQTSPGMIIELDDVVYRVESSIKVSAPKGNPFIKTKLRDLKSEKVIEKNFKTNQLLEEVKPAEHILEYLYDEKKQSVFLDSDSLELIRISPEVLGDKIDYLKEGIQLKAKVFKSQIFSIELIQFLELMVVNTEEKETLGSNANKLAVLETGAKIDVPLFIEVGDVVKVDTHAGEYIQRV